MGCLIKLEVQREDEEQQGFNFFLSSLLVVSAASKFVQDGQANIDHFLQHLNHVLLFSRWIVTSDFLAIFSFLVNDMNRTMY